jgi:hypothetical protein
LPPRAGAYQRTSRDSLLAAAVVAFALQALAIYTPALGALFDTSPLSPMDFAVALGCAVSVIPVAELLKVRAVRRLVK